MKSLTLWQFIKSADTDGIRRWLFEHPESLNQGLPFDADNPSTAHPLHRICDGVFNGWYSGKDGAKMAAIFLDAGSDVNGRVSDLKKDTPLTAAASLGADEVAFLLIDRGADIHHKGTHGGTALHWAAWCGRDKIVEKLLSIESDINGLCLDFRSTPLFWAVHGYVFGGETNRHHQVKCAQRLLEYGADPGIPNFEGYTPLQMLSRADDEMAVLINRYAE